MGMLGRLFGRAEDRAAVSAEVAFNVVPSDQGSRATTAMAENLATVLACVNAVATVMGSLMPLVFRPKGDGREELRHHPVARLVRAPYPGMTWPDWMEWAMGSTLLHGNALAEILTDDAGRVTGLQPIPWPNVRPVLLPSGRPAYDVTVYPQSPRRLLAHEVFHLKDRSDNGLVGRSRISRAPSVITNAAALQEYSVNAWENQATPSGAIEIAASLNEDTAKSLRHRLEDRYSGPKNARRIMVLDNGAKWQAMSVSPEDAEVLASRRFSVEELCRLFQVPPPIVQSYEFNTFTNAAQASLWFAQFSLAPWCRKIEAEFARSVFIGNDGAHLEIDLSSLMRGDFETRWKAWEIAVRSDILDRNEIREMEGWGPRSMAEASG